jgi:hypothetical protein
MYAPFTVPLGFHLSRNTTMHRASRCVSNAALLNEARQGGGLVVLLRKPRT